MPQRSQGRFLGRFSVLKPHGAFMFKWMKTCYVILTPQQQKSFFQKLLLFESRPDQPKDRNLQFQPEGNEAETA